MQRSIRSALLVLVLACSMTYAYTLPDEEGYSPYRAVMTGGDSRAISTRPAEASTRFDVSKIGEQVLSEFGRAWVMSRNGTATTESIVLVYHVRDGGYMAKCLNQTNEHQQFTFKWHASVAAIFHTHPNTVNPLPSVTDRRVADRYRVPVFTITRKGLYMYHPETRKISKLQDGMDWLDYSRWRSSLAGQ